MGMAITHRFLDISILKYWHIKRTMKVISIPIDPQPTARTTYAPAVFIPHIL